MKRHTKPDKNPKPIVSPLLTPLDGREEFTRDASAPDRSALVSSTLRSKSATEDGSAATSEVPTVPEPFEVPAASSFIGGSQLAAVGDDRAPGDGPSPPQPTPEELQAKFESEFRPYQRVIFQDQTTGILIINWARQTGKTHVLAAWAVRRLLRYPGRLVVVLSNSKENGAEFAQKCADITVRMGALPEMEDLSPDLSYRNMRYEVRITVQGKVGRIKVLASNPRTARGFSGDLILDEFAFHEDSAAIWAAAEPFFSSNRDYLCRISSTGNGRHNAFYRLASGCSHTLSCESSSSSSSSSPALPKLLCEGGSSVPRIASSTDDKVSDIGSPSPGGEGRDEGGQSCEGNPSPAGLETCATNAPTLDAPRSDEFNTSGCYYLSSSGYTVSCVSRTAAHYMGVPVFDPSTRAEITPAQARARALDKQAYDQNYECVFADEDITLLSLDLISAAERSPIRIDDQVWSGESKQRMSAATGPLEVGNDIGRNHDLSFVTVIERLGSLRRVIAMLRMQGMRGPDQRRQLEVVCSMPRFSSYCGDMTGLGTFFIEELQEVYGCHRIHGVNFAATEPITERIAAEGRKHETARVTEIMATNLLGLFEDRLIEIPNDQQLRDDLRKPERATSPGGRVSIAATRDEAGHADGFWSLALAVRAGEKARVPFQYERVPEHLRRDVESRLLNYSSWESYREDDRRGVLEF